VKEKLSEKISETSTKPRLLRLNISLTREWRRLLLVSARQDMFNFQKKPESFSKRKTQKQNSFHLKKQANYGTETKER